MKLDKAVVMRRIELMQTSGVNFVLNTEIGRDISAREMVDRYDAVVLCAGSGKARTLQIEGHDLQGVHLALDFLRDNTRHLLDGIEDENVFINARDKNVIVLGGGDTGTDCVATALRQGCKSVNQFEIQPQLQDRRIETSNPWPEWPRKQKTDYGQEEAIYKYGVDPRHYLIATKRITGNSQGQVDAVHTIDVNWFKNAAGILEPVDVASTEKVWPADLVLLALGFVGPEDTIPAELKLKRDERSNVQAEFGDFETSMDKVFVAGDMRRGQSLIVWAIQEGKLAAREVDKYLTGKSLIK
jgi:glutamate synthase (NADPH/NADH) small chain